MAFSNKENKGLMNRTERYRSEKITLSTPDTLTHTEEAFYFYAFQVLE